MHATTGSFTRRSRTAIAGLTANWLMAAAAVGPALALDERPADWDANKACEQQMCALILKKEVKGGDLTCALAKTWPKTTLKGGEGKLVKWGFGDARCEVDLSVTRSALLSALTAPAYSLAIPEHKVNCEVESEGAMKSVRAKLAPRIDFKNGKADKVWINLKDVSGPASIKATVKTAASLEDTFGIFHKSMIKSINKFVHKQCIENYGPDAAEFAAKAEAEKAARRAARKAAAGEAAGTQPKIGEGPVSAPPSGPATAVTPGVAASPPGVPPAEAAAKPAQTPAPPTPVAQPPDVTAVAPPSARTSPATAAKREAARAAAAKPKTSAPVQMELRTTAPWDVKPAPPKGP